MLEGVKVANGGLSSKVTALVPDPVLDGLAESDALITREYKPPGSEDCGE